MKRVAGILSVILVLAAFVSPVAAASISGDSSAYVHPYPSGIVQGDLVFGHSEGVTDWVIPGFWTHVGIIGWYDSGIGDWIVIEATTSNGVTFTPLSKFLSRYDTVAIGRVITADATIRYYAAYFAYLQYGKPYNWNYLSKPDIYSDSYYCSQLVWAAYMWASGYSINIDENDGAWSWTYGYAVAPQEVYDDPEVSIIYYHSV
ncbi:hypothetical protein E3E35_09630 [Thermococcus sp. GR7]|uniref:YiiX/YebB-like N1pC/P60 family cysteine hydrolase n=1 Tax=unclassified Thermococcus TaxID=2627626 RepID=UPI00143096F4|nr:MULTISPECIES: YiiX/YebB-like N1pC/P60 family cysteine hydrolase [unclassified Thermococcus]NJE41985.1 hypothetical protein [Thermococcus sp. GR6]NJE47651.1 hypothetical protein [Thermococcus sp. GR7]NJE78935.1 hypothetical protein [Thermococcus sp. GR4]NJF22585.1 hypothetical protein [Thermococcus sp. GR5]